MSLHDALERVRSSTPGPQVAAVFDYDGTLISGYSALAFLEHRLRNREIGLGELAQTVWAGILGVENHDEFTALLERSVEAWAGKPMDELTALGERLFKQSIAAQLHTEMWEVVQAHRDRGHTVVLASSATLFQIAPLARELEADHVLCTKLVIEDGLLTGAVDGPALWGEHKAKAVTDLADTHGIDLAQSFAYSNGAEDLPLLEAVGNPTVVEPEQKLLGIAAERGWPELPCVRRGGPPGVLDVARTAGFYGAFAAAFGTGLGLGLLNRSRRQIVDITASVGADVGLALAGVDVEIVSGAEHLWSSRPCVFVFNHQSKIDPIIVMKLLRQDWTGVAKKEARNIPGFGQLFQIAGVAFVDRGNTAQAKAVLAPAVDKLRNGTSLAISPEGTRSPTPRLGPFKKGAFHIAMQAGVPMVPVVLRGAGEVMWRGAQVMRPGVVEVVVHPPIATDDWRVQTLDRHITEVRDVFVETLTHWPSDTSSTGQSGASS